MCIVYIYMIVLYTKNDYLKYLHYYLTYIFLFDLFKQVYIYIYIHIQTHMFSHQLSNIVLYLQLQLGFIGASHGEFRTEARLVVSSILRARELVRRKSIKSKLDFPVPMPFLVGGLGIL